MFKYSENVKDINTGEVYMVVAPVDGEDATTIVWSDITCSKVLVYPSDQLESTADKVLEKQNAHIVYDVISADENDEEMSVTRKISARGVDAIVSAYADMRNYVSEITGIPIKEIDSLIAETTQEGE